MKTYSAQAKCTNCGYENYPQWGTYEYEKKISDHKCPNCKCFTLIPRPHYSDPDLGRTSESKS